jgi:hypothetical protein
MKHTLKSAASVAASVLLFGNALIPSAQAATVTYTMTSGLLDQGPPGAAGQYTLDGVTRTFSTNAIATFTATADTTSVISATSSSDSGSSIMYYNLVGNIAITIVDGATTLNFNAGAQGSLLPAAFSFKDQAGSYSGIGFGVIDTSAPYTTTNPYAAGLAIEITSDSSFYNNLQSLETFNGPYQFIPVSSLQVTSGQNSGILQFNNAGSSPSFSISAAPIPEPSSLFLGLFGSALIIRRRRMS